MFKAVLRSVAGFWSSSTIGHVQGLSAQLKAQGFQRSEWYSYDFPKERALKTAGDYKADGVPLGGGFFERTANGQKHIVAILSPFNPTQLKQVKVGLIEDGAFKGEVALADYMKGEGGARFLQTAIGPYAVAKRPSATLSQSLAVLAH